MANDTPYCQSKFEENEDSPVLIPPQRAPEKVLPQASSSGKTADSPRTTEAAGQIAASPHENTARHPRNLPTRSVLNPHRSILRKTLVPELGMVGFLPMIRFRPKVAETLREKFNGTFLYG